MQLSYRGHTYEAHNSAPKTTETGKGWLGLFLGHHFKIKQLDIAQNHTSPHDFTYRGVHYQH